MTLTKQDMQLMIKIIDVAAQRGSFRGDELYTAGYIRNKLVEIISEETQPAEADLFQEKESEK